MSIRKTGKTIAQQKREFKRLRQSLPTLVGNEAVNFYKRSFKRQGFIDERFERWKKRKEGDGKNRKRRAILIKTGRLRRSIRVTSKSTNYVTIGTDVPYAKIHNEGGRINKEVRVREHKRRARGTSTRTARKSKSRSPAASITVSAHKRKMNTTIDQRQFIGESKFFNKRIRRKVSVKLRDIFK